MKKIIGVAVLCAVVLAGYAAAGPFITIHRIKSAIERQEPERLVPVVDFPALRASAKEQLAALAAKQAASGLRDDPLAALATGFSAKLAAGLVDSLVTPDGVTSLIGSLRPPSALPDPPGAWAVPDVPPRGAGRDLSGPAGAKADLFPDVRYSCDGLSRFSVWVPLDRGREIGLVLVREGLSWRLARIVLPDRF